MRHGHETPQFGAFHGEPAELRTLGGLVAAVWKLEARAVIQLGLGLLIATPVARVVFSLFAFIRQRDGMYVVITSIVLAVLLLGLFSAHGILADAARPLTPQPPAGPRGANFSGCATSHSGRRFG